LIQLESLAIREEDFSTDYNYSSVMNLTKLRKYRLKALLVYDIPNLNNSFGINGCQELLIGHLVYVRNRCKMPLALAKQRIIHHILNTIDVYVDLVGLRHQQSLILVIE